MKKMFANKTTCILTDRIYVLAGLYITVGLGTRHSDQPHCRDVFKVCVWYLLCSFDALPNMILEGIQL